MELKFTKFEMSFASALSAINNMVITNTENHQKQLMEMQQVINTLTKENKRLVEESEPKQGEKVESEPRKKKPDV